MSSKTLNKRHSRVRTEHTSFLSFPAFESESTQKSEKKNIIKQKVKSTVAEIWPD